MLTAPAPAVLIVHANASRVRVSCTPVVAVVADAGGIAGTIVFGLFTRSGGQRSAAAALTAGIVVWLLPAAVWPPETQHAADAQRRASRA